VLPVTLVYQELDNASETLILFVLLLSMKS
jgi:hypothetical protein